MTSTAPSPPTSEERKRLGQYFTSVRLARLLAAFADAAEAHRIVDPMAGSGNMLIGAVQAGAKPELLAGIELDPWAAHNATEALEATPYRHSLATGNAFSADRWAYLGDSWDLVITNPPYVRYQLGFRSADHIPSALEIRDGLIECVKASAALEDSEREVFLDACHRYSGLADLAVPAWLLCMAQVRVGGRIAMVVPNTWLTREYAAWIALILRRFFDIRAVVTDTDRSWFDDALVRTDLVIAERVPDKGSALKSGRHPVVYLTRSAESADSLIGGVRNLTGEGCLEQRFARRVLRNVRGRPAALYTLRFSDEQDLKSLIRKRGLEGSPQPHSHLPERFLNSLPTRNPSLISLADVHWSVGQGLRTGANDFFYVTRNTDGTYTSALMPDTHLRLPPDSLKPAVRRQSTVAGRLTVSQLSTDSFVLALDDYVHPQDMSAGETRRVMTGDLEELVTRAAKHTYARGDQQVPLPELSAVRTNVRHAGEKHTFWYHLPPFAARHIPSVLLPRINNGTPRAVLCQGLTVDANFTTLWPQEGNALPPLAMIAIMHSPWATAWMETCCTVMGAGALKVEAAHIRHLPLPQEAVRNAQALAAVGEAICNLGEVHKEHQQAAMRLLGMANAWGPLTALARSHMQQRGKTQ